MRRSPASRSKTYPNDVTKNARSQISDARSLYLLGVLGRCDVTRGQRTRPLGHHVARSVPLSQFSVLLGRSRISNHNFQQHYFVLNNRWFITKKKFSVFGRWLRFIYDVRLRIAPSPDPASLSHQRRSTPRYCNPSCNPGRKTRRTRSGAPSFKLMSEFEINGDRGRN
jgi:hypothetical protein